jgi:hypothetical protein
MLTGASHDEWCARKEASHSRRDGFFVAGQHISKRQPAEEGLLRSLFICPEYLKFVFELGLSHG